MVIKVKGTKKVTVGGFAVFHEGPNEYTVRHAVTNSVCSVWPNLSQAFSAAQRRQAIEEDA